MAGFSFVFLLCGLIPAVLCGLFAPKQRAHYDPELDKFSAGPGDPLFLTSYIEQGQIAQGELDAETSLFYNY